MILNSPSIDLITLDQIKYIKSIEIDPRMTIREKVEKFNFKLVVLEDIECGGYFDIEKKEIAIHKDFYKSKEVETIISHELSHYVQSQTVDDKQYSIVQSIQYEQQAESISKYFLMKKLFTNKEPTYYSYFTREDWIWLSEYYSSCESIENDLEMINI